MFKHISIAIESGPPETAARDFTVEIQRKKEVRKVEAMLKSGKNMKVQNIMHDLLHLTF